MGNKKINKAKILKSITKMVADKETVRSYIKGKANKEQINERGIKFAKPI